MIFTVSKCLSVCRVSVEIKKHIRDNKTDLIDIGEKLFLVHGQLVGRPEQLLFLAPWQLQAFLFTGRHLLCRRMAYRVREIPFPEKEPSHGRKFYEMSAREHKL